jgi:hypothetical protein
MEPGALARAICDMTPTDADAIRRSLDEPAAFDAVFDRHFAAVYAFAQGQGRARLLSVRAVWLPLDHRAACSVTL